MGGLFTILAVIAAGAASVYFISSSMGIQLIRKKSVSTILKGEKARQSSAPQAPLHEIYYSLAEESAQQSQWLADANYVDVLRGGPDVSIRDRRHNPNNLLSSWRAWRRRFNSKLVVR